MDPDPFKRRWILTVAGSAASKVDLPSSSFSTLTAVWLNLTCVDKNWPNCERSALPDILNRSKYGDLPLKKEPGSEISHLFTFTFTLLPDSYWWVLLRRCHMERPTSQRGTWQWDSRQERKRIPPSEANGCPQWSPNWKWKLIES